MTDQFFSKVVDALIALKEDGSVPKNLQIKLAQTIQVLLEKNSPASMIKNKAMSLLEDLGEDVNIDPYIRTQLFNVVSMLDGIRD